MRTSDWLTVAFLAYLVARAVAFGAPRGRLVRLLVLAAACSLPSVVLSQFDPSPLVQTARDWLPGLYLLLGYWAAGLAYREPHIALENWLRRMDRQLFAFAGPVIARGPRLALEAVELAYLLYYPLVPAGLVALYLFGLRASADAYWTAVLLAAFACCAVLPIAGTRPPRALECELWIDGRPVLVRRVNCAVLRLGSIQVNTFPSAHAATSAAIAVFLVPLGWTAVPFAIVAAGIGVGAVVGRYHYGLDVAIGVVIGVLAGVVVRV